MANEENTAAAGWSSFTMSPLLCILSMGLGCLSTLFQTIAFSTHAWFVMTEFMTDNDTGQIQSVEIYTGLWYTVKCQNGACKSTTHLNGFMDDLDAGRHYKEIQYSLRVWSQTLSTLALISSVVSAVSCIPVLCKSRRVMRIHLVIVVCSIISFCLLMAVVFNWTSEVSANAKLKLDPNRTFSFPWSLLLAGLGGCGNLTLGIIHFVLLFRSLEPSVSVRNDTFQPNAYIQLTTQTSVTSQITNGSVRHGSHNGNHLTIEKEIAEENFEENLEENEQAVQLMENQLDLKVEKSNVDVDKEIAEENFEENLEENEQAVRLMDNQIDLKFKNSNVDVDF
ncbi:uncharacterized protein LOC125649993 isoform X1 [Ostrea edulis]|uniref:uncharacterized protein LOC125649993 isoform X1 n=1 Tax=Ostrea edulis TaxID=37623 RepID=UPI0020942C1F|nr:uncharacterized protein LOC125649993 isoform X1 [Ostrea edulis]